MTADYHYDLTTSDHCTLYFALGYATSAAMKDGEPQIAQSIYELACRLSIQFRMQTIGETRDGEANSVTPNAIPTDGTD